MISSPGLVIVSILVAAAAGHGTGVVANPAAAGSGQQHGRSEPDLLRPGPTPQHDAAAHEQFGGARQLAARGDVDGAVGLLVEALARDPLHPQQWVLLGELCLAAEDPGLRARAPAAYRRALQSSPENLELHMELIRAYQELGLSDDARREFERLLAQHPDFDRGWLGLGLYHTFESRHREALAAFDEALRLRPDWPAAHLARANALERLRRTPEAQEGYARVWALSPGSAEAAFGLGTTALTLGDSAAAVAALERVPLEGRSAEARLALGKAYLRLGRLEDARRSLEQATAADPQGREAWVALAQVLARLGDARADEALVTAEALSREEPSQLAVEIEDTVTRRGEYLLFRALVYLNEGRADEALRLLDEAEPFASDQGEIEGLREEARALLAAGPAAGTPQAAPRGSERRGDASPAGGGASAGAPRGAPADAWLGPFVDVAAARGLTAVNHSGTLKKHLIVESTGSGAAWLDYDRDGRPDLFLADGNAIRYLPFGDGGTTFEVTERPGDALMRQQPGGVFADAGEKAGVADPGWAGGVAVGDFDNDGWPDLYLTHYGPNRMYRNNGDGTFSDVTASMAADDARWSASAAFADLDGDGFLDLYVSNYLLFDPAAPPFEGKLLCRFIGVPAMCGPGGMEGLPDRLLWSAGGAGFIAAEPAALGNVAFNGLGVMPIDANGDGLLDLYVANDMTPNLLFLNEGERRLSEQGLLYGVAYSGDGRVQAGMGIATGDIDGNDRDDLVVTNFSHDTNTVYLNTGELAYLDVTASAGLGTTTFPYLGWGVQLRDLDLDGDLDLFIANGHVYPQVDEHEIGTWYRQRNQLFANVGGRFLEVAASVSGAGMEIAESSRGAVAADFDGDGDEDLLVTNIDAAPTLLLNQQATGNGWLQVRLVGRRSNRDGIGARIVVRGGERAWSRTVQTAAGYLGANDPTATFGTGAARRVDLEIRWPSGAVDRLDGVLVDRLVVVAEGRGLVAERRAVATEGRRVVAPSVAR